MFHSVYNCKYSSGSRNLQIDVCVHVGLTDDPAVEKISEKFNGVLSLL